MKNPTKAKPKYAHETRRELTAEEIIRDMATHRPDDYYMVKMSPRRAFYVRFVTQQEYEKP